MFKHVLIVAWRNIRKYKISAGIGIVGLAMGLLCFVLCNFCARLFLNTDKSFPHYGRIAEVQLKVGEGDGVQDFFAGTPPTLKAVLKNDFPRQVECFTAVSYWAKMNATFEKSGGKKMVYDVNTIEVDRDFETVFSCRLLEGNWEQLFRQRNAVVLSCSFARKVYGDQSPMGQVFHPNEFTFRTTGEYTPEDLAAVDYVVMGVMEDLPMNVSFSFLNPVDALLINDEHGLFAQYSPEKGGSGCTTFALLRPGVDRKAVNQQVNPEKHRIQISGMEGIPLFLLLGEHGMEYYHIVGYFYLGIGLLILLVAGLNFFTFIAGNFFNRIKEYSIRKGIGGNRWQLLGLLFAETMLLLIPVGIMVACMVELLYMHLDFSLTMRKIVFQSNVLYVQLLEYFGFGVVICALVCWGISFYLSRKYIRTGIGHGLKGGKQRLRNVMLGIQLVISLLFFTGGLAVYLQTEILTRNIFPFLNQEEKERILEVDLTFPQLKGREAHYIERLKQIPEVADVLITDYNLFFGRMATITVRVEDRYLEFDQMKASGNFAAYLNLPLLTGQIFQYPGQVVADQSVQALYGGNLVERGFEDIEGVKINVCGIVENLPRLYTEGARSRVWSMSEKPAWCYLKVHPGTQGQVIGKVRQMLGEVVPETMELKVPSLTELIHEQNKQQEQAKTMLLFFTIVCLLITVLGIYSAISVDTERRQKEIAIRKINGASTYHIVRLFIRLYLKLLIIAIIIAFPILWWAIQQWLSLFNVRFYTGVWFWIFIIFVMSGVIALTIAWKIREIIRMNPVEVIRNE